ncbi:hypothetical protein M3Y94_00047300 [Aphelenchoides besseyi]|nr:hypothetical protein M3Y94_00047300 [Aphelenchoides besseyi]
MIAGASCAPIHVTAQLLTDQYTTFFTKLQMVKILEKVGNDFYIQKSNDKIAQDISNKLDGVTTKKQQVTYQTRYRNLCTKLGQKECRRILLTIGQLHYNGFNKVATQAKQVSATALQGGATKVEAINAAWQHTQQVMPTYIKNSAAYLKGKVTPVQWNLIKSSLGNIILFNLY